MSNSISERDTIIVYKDAHPTDLPKRESNPYWITITPIPVQFKGYSSVPDGTQGLVVGICSVFKNALVVRANYPNWGNDVWAIGFDHVEEGME